MPRCHRSLALAAWRPRDPFEYGDRTYRNTAIAPVEYNNRTETDRSVITGPREFPKLMNSRPCLRENEDVVSARPLFGMRLADRGIVLLSERWPCSSSFPGLQTDMAVKCRDKMLAQPTGALELSGGARVFLDDLLAEGKNSKPSIRGAVSQPSS